MSDSHFGAVNLDQLQTAIAGLEHTLAELRAIQIQRHTQVSRPDADDTDDTDAEGRYAYQLLERLEQKERETLELAYAEYLVDHQQPDEPRRHRDFILGWIACYRAHDLGPKYVRVVVRESASSEPVRTYSPAPRPMVYRSEETAR